MNKTESNPFIFGTRPITFSGDPDNPPAHERLGALFSQIIAQNDFAQSRPLLVELGIHPEDVSGLTRMHALIQQVKDAKINLYKQTDIAPIYQLKKDKKPIGLFKIGRKRAAIELLVRKVAHITGLAEHTTPGVFCALGNYHSTQWEDVFEDLWNGQLKNYLDDQADLECAKDPAIVGILEPFDPRQKTTSVEEFAKMTLLALVVGLRDGKDDGYGGSSWFDCEDAFPIRLDPPDNNSVAATDLPYLSDSKANALLSSDIISKLKALAQSWNLEEIRTYLAQATIDYADTKAEEIPFLTPPAECLDCEELLPYLEEIADDYAKTKAEDCSSSADSENSQLFDEGHNAISLQEPQQPHTLNGILNHWDIEQNPDRLCLLPAQIETTLERIRRIQAFLASSERFRMLDLVYDVDPWAKQYSNFCTSSNDTPNSPFKTEIGRTLSTCGPEAIVGRKTPLSLLNPALLDFRAPTPLNLSFAGGSTPKNNPTP